MEAGIKLFGKTITLPQLTSKTIKQEGAGEGVIIAAAAASPEELSTTTTTTTTSSGGGSGGGASSTNTNKDHHHHHHRHHDVVVQNIKRPDKIVACPRCKSLETKFCYFNNYNVNQPRHFCKSCQRYWTAGGALRNVPIGAGRRKAKPMPLLAQGPPTSTSTPNPTVLVDYSATACAVFDAAATASASSYHDEVVLQDYWNAVHRRHQQPARGGLCDDFPVKRRREERAI